MKDTDIKKLLDIGIALSREKDAESLLETILIGAMDITNCDAGTLYILSEDSLIFRIMITKSLGIVQHQPVGLPPVPLSRENVCACAVLDRKLINIPDVYSSELFDFSGPRNYDAMTGYKTVSQMVVPMEDDHGDVIGVLQLINAIDKSGRTIPFRPEFEQVLHSLASQTAISLTNQSLSAEIEELLNSFVRVMSTAIDARSSYTADHTRNMVRYGENFLRWLEQNHSGWHLGKMEQRQFLMSVWLHDVGKLVVPLEIMDKDSRLGPAYYQVIHRFEIAQLTTRIDLLNQDISKEAFEQRTTFIEESRKLVETANKAFALDDEIIARVNALAQKSYIGSDGQEYPFLTSEELNCLSVRRGTLTAEERSIMENHVTMTKRMLDQMIFSRNYRLAPQWAASHHEFLDGTGYPDHLKAPDIPKEVRLLTILDIFDALTAQNRPYKKAFTLERALDILQSMADEGKLDGEILSLFRQSEAWIDV